MRARIVVKTGVVLLLAAASAMVAPTVAPAGADPGSAGAGSGGGTVSVGAGSGSGSGGSPGGSGGGSSTGGGSGGSPWTCTYTYLALNNAGGFPNGGPIPGAWYSVTCDDIATQAQVTQTVWITGGQTAPVPQVDPRVLALQARNSIALPAPVVEVNPSASSVVGLATWLWVDPSLWHDYSVTASAGAVSATAVARPVGVSWSTGDGGSEVCGGPGDAYVPWLPSLEQQTYCSHQFTRTSIGQPSPDGDPDHGQFVITATVEWAVSWSAVGAAGGGALPTLYTTGTTGLRVVQIESLNAVPSFRSPTASAALGFGA
jgi:hypothetical protein